MAETPEKQPVIPPAPEIDVIKPIEPAEPSKEKKPVMSEAELAREKETLVTTTATEAESFMLQEKKLRTLSEMTNEERKMSLEREIEGAQFAKDCLAVLDKLQKKYDLAKANFEKAKHRADTAIIHKQKKQYEHLKAQGELEVAEGELTRQLAKLADWDKQEEPQRILKELQTELSSLVEKYKNTTNAETKTQLAQQIEKTRENILRLKQRTEIRKKLAHYHLLKDALLKDKIGGLGHSQAELLSREKNLLVGTLKGKTGNERTAVKEARAREKAYFASPECQTRIATLEQEITILKQHLTTAPAEKPATADATIKTKTEIQQEISAKENTKNSLSKAVSGLDLDYKERSWLEIDTANRNLEEMRVDLLGALYDEVLIEEKNKYEKALAEEVLKKRPWLAKFFDGMTEASLFKLFEHDLKDRGTYGKVVGTTYHVILKAMNAKNLTRVALLGTGGVAAFMSGGVGGLLVVAGAAALGNAALTVLGTGTFSGKMGEKLFSSLTERKLKKGVTYEDPKKYLDELLELKRDNRISESEYEKNSRYVLNRKKGLIFGKKVPIFTKLNSEQCHQLEGFLQQRRLLVGKLSPVDEQLLTDLRRFQIKRDVDFLDPKVKEQGRALPEKYFSAEDQEQAKQNKKFRSLTAVLDALSEDLDAVSRQSLEKAAHNLKSGKVVAAIAGALAGGAALAKGIEMLVEAGHSVATDLAQTSTHPFDSSYLDHPGQEGFANTAGGGRFVDSVREIKVPVTENGPFVDYELNPNIHYTATSEAQKFMEAHHITHSVFDKKPGIAAMHFRTTSGGNLEVREVYADGKVDVVIFDKNGKIHELLDDVNIKHVEQTPSAPETTAETPVATADLSPAQLAADDTALKALDEVSAPLTSVEAKELNNYLHQPDILRRIAGKIKHELGKLPNQEGQEWLTRSAERQSRLQALREAYQSGQFTPMEQRQLLQVLKSAHEQDMQNAPQLFAFKPGEPNVAERSMSAKIENAHEIAAALKYEPTMPPTLEEIRALPPLPAIEQAGQALAHAQPLPATAEVHGNAVDLSAPDMKISPAAEQLLHQDKSVITMGGEHGLRFEFYKGQGDMDGMEVKVSGNIDPGVSTRGLLSSDVIAPSPALQTRITNLAALIEGYKQMKVANVPTEQLQALTRLIKQQTESLEASFPGQALNYQNPIFRVLGIKPGVADDAIYQLKFHPQEFITRTETVRSFVNDSVTGNISDPTNNLHKIIEDATNLPQSLVDQYVQEGRYWVIRESSGNPGIINLDTDGHGTPSYGLHQYVPGNVKEMIGYLKGQQNRFGDLLDQAGTPGTASFNTAWKDLGKQYPVDFSNAQNSYLENVYLPTRIAQFEAKSGLVYSSLSKPVQRLLEGAIVQYGGNSNIHRLIAEAIQHNLGKSDAEIVAAIQDVRINTAPKFFDKSWVDMVIKRAEAEKQWYMNWAEAYHQPSSALNFDITSAVEQGGVIGWLDAQNQFHSVEGFIKECPVDNFNKYDSLIVATAEKYGIPPELLKATIVQESRFHPEAINTNNDNGTIDLGLTQINSSNYNSPHWGDDPFWQNIKSDPRATLSDPAIAIEASGRTFKFWIDTVINKNPELANLTGEQKWKVISTAYGEGGGSIKDLHGAIPQRHEKYEAQLFAIMKYLREKDPSFMAMIHQAEPIANNGAVSQLPIESAPTVLGPTPPSDTSWSSTLPQWGANDHYTGPTRIPNNTPGAETVAGAVPKTPESTRGFWSGLFGNNEKVSADSIVLGHDTVSSIKNNSELVEIRCDNGAVIFFSQNKYNPGIFRIENPHNVERLDYLRVLRKNLETHNLADSKMGKALDKQIAILEKTSPAMPKVPIAKPSLETAIPQAPEAPAGPAISLDATSLSNPEELLKAGEATLHTAQGDLTFIKQGGTSNYEIHLSNNVRTYGQAKEVLRTVFNQLQRSPQWKASGQYKAFGKMVQEITRVIGVAGPNAPYTAVVKSAGGNV